MLILMELIFEQLLLFFMCITMSHAAADLLRNPDFEIPSINVTSNETSNIPGWSINGTIYYVTLSNGNHAIQLAENGKINQTLRAASDDALDYILSFNLGAINLDCANYNRTAVNVTVNERSVPGRWSVFYFERNLSTKLWETRALFLGQLMGTGDYVNIEIKSVTTNSEDDHNITCWPVVDAFTVKTNRMARWYNANLLANGDFEVGPAFLKNSSDGILLNQDQEETFYSPLKQWSILGTIKYIDSKHFKVPHGNVRVECLAFQLDWILFYL